MKRVYKAATAERREEGYVICLDGRPVRTPARQPLIFPAAPLAEAVAGEWAGQEKVVDPRAMPLMRLSCTALDRVAGRRETVIDELARYAETDLLCYRAEHPPELQARQAEAWQPLLDWALMRFDAKLEVVFGIVPAAQPEATQRALRSVVAGLDDFSLTGVYAAAATTGSLIVALALMEGEVGAEDAFAISQLDETYAIEQWGEDAELGERRASIRDELESTERFLRLARAA